MEVVITSSVLIAALLLLRLAFVKRVSRRLIYGAWILVALRLLIPVQIGQLDFSVLTAAQPLTETVTEMEALRVIGQNEREASIQITKDYIEQDQTVFTPEVQEYIQSAQKENRPAEEIAAAIIKTQGEEIYIPQVRPQVQQQVEEKTDFVSLGQLAMIVWLAGVAVMAVWFAFVNLRQSLLLRKHRQGLECDSRIPVYVSEKVSSPCLVGLVRPAVYLTPACVEKPDMLRHVLTHELTHYRHGDHIWALVRCVCLCVYWFNPLVWVAAWASRRDCELACDEGALKRLGEDERIVYGKTLLEVVSHAATPAGLLTTATAMAETKKQLKERVNFIVKKPKISLIAVISLVLICAIVAACTALGPAEKNGGDAASIPTGSEDMVTIYMVTGQKIYKNGELVATATFEYDDYGRPTVIGFEEADGSGRKAELTYDQMGNLVGEHNTYLYANGEESVQQLDWNLTYTDGLLSRAERLSSDGESYVLNFGYDDNKQMVFVEYPQPEEGMGGKTWQSYAYDEDGKLIQETRCVDNFGEYSYNRVCYFYDDQDRLTEQYFCTARSDALVGPEELDQLVFEISRFEHYFFYYDEKGKLAYVGEGAEDTYDGGRAWIYSDEDYTFDENGNLVRIDQGIKLGQKESDWIEYTYKAITVQKSDAVMHKRMIHGISAFVQSATRYNTQDPLFWEMCPKALYSYHLQGMTFYYLIPYPQLELFL